MPDRSTSRFRFHEPLDRFLRPRRRGAPVDRAFDGTPAVKDPIEALGVPHTEIGALRIDGRAAAMATRIRGGETIDVLPVLEQPAGSPPRFVLDVHLGRLAGYLRLLGIDTLYRNDADDDVLLAVSVEQGRVLLSCDTGLLKRAALVDGAFVYATKPLCQVAEVVGRFGLQDSLVPFSRCSTCNGGIEPAAPETVVGQVPPRARVAATAFSRCRGCGQAYWRGTHETRLRERLSSVGIRI